MAVETPRKSGHEVDEDYEAARADSMPGGKRKSLFDLGAERQSVLDAIDAAEGVISEEQETLLATLDAAIINKADAVGWVLGRLNAEATALKDRAAALAAQAKSRETMSERIKERVAAYLVTHGESRLTGNDFRITLQESESVVVDPIHVASMPVRFLRFPDPQPNKDEIKKALKQGVVLSGVSLVKKSFVVVR